MNIIDKALESRQLSQNSINLYKRNLLKLNDNKPIKSFNFLKNKEEIMNIIKELKPTTQRSYIISICSVLRDIPKHKKMYEEYFELLKDFNNNELKVNTDKTPKQEKNWISQEEVLRVHKKLKEDVMNLLKKKRKIDKATFNKLFNYTILSLYTLINPRRNKDYSLNASSAN
jgi:wyosine [tRNA(Phe)-imidazoG37] synthetase (radical SAM superfamily)